MPNVQANGIQIEYDIFGNPVDPALLLIMGLGRQMVFVDEDLCEELAKNNLFVIRFDNRDVGLSTKFEEAGVPDVMAAITASMQGQPVQAPYTIDDMADDAVALLSAIGIEKAHICGLSMGATITQTIGYRHPSKALTLIPIMGTTGNPALPQGKLEALQLLYIPWPTEREAFLEHWVKLWHAFWGSYNYDPKYMRKFGEFEYDRAFYPQGEVRQLIASIAHGNLKSYLSKISAPTLVIHGKEDPIFPIECGKDIAEEIPGAELMIIEGMGHCLPRETWPQIIDAIAKHTVKVTS